MGKKKGKKKKQRKRVLSAEWVYNGFYWWTHRRNVSVGESATSLYDYLGLNPPVIPSVKSSYKNPRHRTVATFQTNCIGHQRYGRYIPTELEMELFPSVKITDEKIPSVIPLVFAGFMVVLA
jgi:hypothetical protein